MRYPKKPSEAQTLRAVKDWLRAKKYLYIRVNNMRLSPPNKQGKRFFIPIDNELRGAPDLIVFKELFTNSLTQVTRVFALEIKSHNGKLRPEQIKWAERAGKAGIQCHVIRSINDLEKILE